jgi:hypothetical protein
MYTVYSAYCTSILEKQGAEKNKYLSPDPEVGANDRSAQELESALKNEVYTNFLTEIWPF